MILEENKKDSIVQDSTYRQNIESNLHWQEGDQYCLFWERYKRKDNKDRNFEIEGRNANKISGLGYERKYSSLLIQVFPPFGYIIYYSSRNKSK